MTRERVIALALLAGAAVLIALFVALGPESESESYSRGAVELPQRSARGSSTLADSRQGQCSDHPYLVREVGTVLRYRAEVPEGPSTFVLKLLDHRSTPTGSESRWERSLELEGFPAVDDTILTGCRNGEGMTEPWTWDGPPGIVRAERAWRWPSRLAMGTAFEGVAEVEMMGQAWSYRRRHEVRGRELVHTPAGTFDSWRVDVVDSVDRGASRRGEVWISPDVGLVRARWETDPAESVSMELTAIDPVRP